jgi:predicted transcriptional regulator
MVMNSSEARQFIINLIANHNYTQQRIATLLGKDQSEISRYLRENNGPTETLGRIWLVNGIKEWINEPIQEQIILQEFREGNIEIIADPKNSRTLKHKVLQKQQNLKDLQKS